MRRPRALFAFVVTLAVIGAMLFFFFDITRRYDVTSAAMEPTLHCPRPAPGCEGGSRDHLLVVHRFYSPGRGDIVALSPTLGHGSCAQAKTTVRRLIGLPGDAVTERAGRISVNGQPLRESYVRHRDHGAGSWRVPKGRYFVLGDNRLDRCDSRAWGAIARGKIIGEVVLTYWPFRRIGAP